MKCYRCGKWDGQRCGCKDGQTIIHGDCREFLPELPEVDLVLTDPPYGAERFLPANTYARDRKKSRSHLAAANEWGRLEWDANPPSVAELEQIIGKGEHAVVFGGNYFPLPASSCWLVWDKDNGASDFADCELAWTNLKKAVRKFRWRWNGMLQEKSGDQKEQRYHPTQKPVPVMRWCLTQAPESCETVLDPFMGSGTTLVACSLEGRRGIGIELEERYCEIAANRLRQGVLFGVEDQK